MSSKKLIDSTELEKTETCEDLVWKGETRVQKISNVDSLEAKARIWKKVSKTNKVMQISVGKQNPRYLESGKPVRPSPSK